METIIFNLKDIKIINQEDGKINILVLKRKYGKKFPRAVFINKS